MYLEFVYTANPHLKSTVKKKKTLTFAHLVNFLTQFLNPDTDLLIGHGSKCVYICVYICSVCECVSD